MSKRKFLRVSGIAIGILVVGVFFALGFHRSPKFIRHFEMEEYSVVPVVEPDSIEDGLAVYSVGDGDPVLLFPYPHGHTTEPMAQAPLADILVALGLRVITFDVPGAYRSTREPTGTMDEMIAAADETLARLGIEGPVNVVGHSMSGFAALAYAIERPERVMHLVLANSVSGFPAAARCGYPGTAFKITDANYWRVIFWGMQVNGGRASLETHKKLQNLMQEHAFFDPAFYTPLEIQPDDAEQGVPIRMIWSKNMYSGLSYADRLGEVRAETLVIAGRHDPEAGMACADELVQGIGDALMVIFERSGHAPFIEEAGGFQETVGAFLIRRP